MRLSMYYSNAGFFGMHMFWWMFWIGAFVFGTSLFEPVRRSQSRQYKSSPLEILQKRYANGEVSDEEYEKKKSRLERDGTASDASRAKSA
jgi:putative membrane protein